MHFHLPHPHLRSISHIIEQVLDVMKNYKHEKESEAHQIFRQAAGHQPKGVQPETINPVRSIDTCCGPCCGAVTDPPPQDEETVPGILHPGSTGVIYCSDRAMANGFSMASAPEWANFGQGAPEVGPIPDCPPRPESVSIPLESMEYAPTTGVKGTIPPQP